MAQHFWGINYGDSATTGIVTTGTSDTTKDFQIVTTDGTGANRRDVKRYIERLLRFIVAEDTSSPFSG